MLRRPVEFGSQSLQYSPKRVIHGTVTKDAIEETIVLPPHDLDVRGAGKKGDGKGRGKGIGKKGKCNGKYKGHKGNGKRASNGDGKWYNHYEGGGRHKGKGQRKGKKRNGKHAGYSSGRSTLGCQKYRDGSNSSKGRSKAGNPKSTTSCKDCMVGRCTRAKCKFKRLGDCVFYSMYMFQG